MKASQICLILLFLGIALPVAAQEQPKAFVLPDGRTGEAYQANIESILRDTYRLKLETSTRTPVIQWLLADGVITPGLVLRTDGLIAGTPQSKRVGTYSFKLRVIDQSAPDSDLVLSFNLTINPGRLRLSQIEGPRLVPVESQRLLTTYTPQGFNSPANESRDESKQTAQPPDANSLMPPKAEPKPAVDPPPSIEFDTQGVTSGGSDAHFSEARKSFTVKVKDSTRLVCLLDTLIIGDRSRLISDQKSVVDYNNKDSRQEIQAILGKGSNDITVTAYVRKQDQKCTTETDLNTLTPLAGSLTFTVNCDGPKCGSVTTETANQKDKNTTPHSNKFTRAIFGMEQSGASSAASESHPFIDFFFNAPLTARKLLAWGDVRLTTTPQQVTAFISSTANVAATVTGDKVNDLATSFDFKFGPELQLNPANDKHRVSLIIGFGATSPLTTPAQSAQIFKVPSDSTNSQFADFFKDYPEAVGKTYIAFVRPERDRFLRQYFGGLRLKSYPAGNKFPSMLDVTFGQNSAVTGGKLRHFVLGIDGSYHLTFFDKSMYIFGSTSLKFGGDKTVRSPYVLEPADTNIKLTSPALSITSRQMNRDVFRLGFGIDLVELFKPKSDKPAQ